MGRYHSVPETSSKVRYEMILSLVSSVLFASVALGAPGASNYGAAAVVGPAKQIASTPSIQCRTEYVTLWDTEYQEKEEQVCVTEYKQDCQFEWRGHGNDKVWAPIEGTCQNFPY